jgi:2-haloacid dehalogenase
MPSSPDPTTTAPLVAEPTDPVPAPTPSPAVVLFDVNETLSDMAPMAARFEDVGASPALATTWFASLLRDGFALTAAGASAPFAMIGAELLRTLLPADELNRSLDAAVEHILSGFSALPVHPDVPEGLRALAATGRRLVTLSNGSASVAEGLLERSGLTSCVQRLLSVEDAGAWKPAAAAYTYAAAQCGVQAHQMVLVTVHPWDVDGAGRAGLRTAWLNRSAARYPAHFRRPDLKVASLLDLADRLSSELP